MKIFYWLLLLLGAVLLGATTAQAQSGPHRAGLVVRYADGSVEAACVAFAEEQISGVELLTRSGLPVSLQDGGVGTAVCKIGPDGCDYPAEQCFCERDGPRAIYWAYYEQAGDSWRYATLGAGNTTVRDGAVHGWAWGAGDSSGGAVPPLLALDAICGPPQQPARQTQLSAPEPTPTSLSVAYPLPSPAAAANPYPAAGDFYPAAPPPPPDELMGGVGQLLVFGLFTLLLAAALGTILWKRR